MLDQLDAADSVLVVCTETYYRRFRGHEEPGNGKGVDWEGALITQEMMPLDRLLSQEKKTVDLEVSAQRDLDEAWEIAERGPMPLFLADVHFYRARLFHAATPYPWATAADGRARGPLDDLAEARRLIEKHGYWRRKEELEDAEAAARYWV